MDIAPILSAVAGGMVTGIPSLILTLNERKRRQTDYMAQITEAACKLVKPLSDRIDSLEGTVSNANKTIEDLTDKLNDAQTTIENQSREIAEVKRENRDLRGEVLRLSKENEAMCLQLQELGVKPARAHARNGSGEGRG